MSLVAVRRICTKVNFRLNTAGLGADRRKDHEVLGVAANAEEKEIKRAYHNMLKRYHPSQYGAKFDSEITENYIQKKVAYLSLMYEEKTWRKRFKHRFGKFASYFTSFLVSIAIYEALRYGLKELYERINQSTHQSDRLP